MAQHYAVRNWNQTVRNRTKQKLCIQNQKKKQHNLPI